MVRFARSLVLLAAAVAAAGCGSVYVVPEDVTGTIVDITRAPLPGAQVLVGDTLTTTDEAGHFTVKGVTPPYDLAVAYLDIGVHTTSGNVYLGMTDRAPTVLCRMFGPGSAPHDSSATLSVVLPAAEHQHGPGMGGRRGDGQPGMGRRSVCQRAHPARRCGRSRW